MSNDLVTYLNPPGAEGLMYGDLVPALQALPAKVQKQPPAQWMATLKSLTQKGVKSAEVDDSRITDWLSEFGKTSVLREDVIREAQRRQVTIKHVVLGSPKFSSHSHLGLFPRGSASYRELLFIANSEKSNYSDRLEELEVLMEDYALDLELLASQPEKLMALANERKRLMTEQPMAYDFPNHHFSNIVNGKHGRNLLAHGREVVAGSLYLIDEIQSDWGQQGRRNNWVGTPKGPFVTDTRLWAGLVLRNMLQRAAMNPEIEKVAWIRGSMSNGGRTVAAHVMDDFYMKTIPSLADKLIAKSGERCCLGNVTMGTTIFADIPLLKMTPEVREILSGPLPLYSETPVRRAPPEAAKQANKQEASPVRGPEPGDGDEGQARERRRESMAG